MGSGIPKKDNMRSPLEDKLTAEVKAPKQTDEAQVPATSVQSGKPSTLSRKPKHARKRLSRMIPVVASPQTHSLSSITPSSESSSNRASTSSTSTDQSLKSTSTTSTPAVSVSIYSGPHLASPCIPNALLHVLSPCGHRVLTRTPEPCGSNCAGNDEWIFANAKTDARFACAVCISTYVREHYQEKKALFVPSLDALERALGGFEVGWKERRIERMERAWRNDMEEEKKALEETGRGCEGIRAEPEEEEGEEVVVKKVAEVKTMKTPGKSVASTGLPVPKEVKTDRLKSPAPKSMVMKKSQLPAPSSKSSSSRSQSCKPVKEKKTVEGGRGKQMGSRLPVGPKMSSKK